MTTLNGRQNGTIAVAMANRDRESIDLNAMIICYREQRDAGRRVSHEKAAAAAGCSRRTAARYWRKGAPPRGDSGPLPPLRELTATPVPAEVVGAVAELKGGARAEASATATIPAASAVAPAPASPSVPAAVQDEEGETIRAIRHASRGVGVIATEMLAALLPLASVARAQLELTAKTGSADARWVATMLESVSTSLGRAAGAVERLVAAQSILSGRPSVVRETRVETDGESDPAIEAFGELLRRGFRGRPAPHRYAGEEGGGIVDVAVSPVRSGQLVATNQTAASAPVT
jgi:hypothetical protein